jgi:hypothetical protein
MPARTLPNLGLQAFFDPGESGWDDEVSLNFLLLSVLVQGGVISTVSATPGSPTNGEVYLLAGDHPTEPNQIAIRDNDEWIYVTPQEGWRIYDRDAGELVLFDGAAWIAFSSGGGSTPYSVPIGFTFAPEESEVLLISVFAEDVTFPDDWAGSQAAVGVNPTATVALSISKNGSPVGSISIATSGVVTFATTGDEVVFAPGDVISVTAPETVDSTIANCAFTLLGART